MWKPVDEIITAENKPSVYSNTGILEKSLFNNISFLFCLLAISANFKSETLCVHDGLGEKLVLMNYFHNFRPIHIDSYLGTNTPAFRNITKQGMSNDVLPLLP